MPYVNSRLSSLQSIRATLNEFSYMCLLIERVSRATCETNGHNSCNTMEAILKTVRAADGELDLCHYRHLGPDKMRTIMREVNRNERIISLNVYYGGPEVADALRTNTSIKELCVFLYEDIRPLMEALRENRTLDWIEVWPSSGNEETMVNCILELLEVNKTIRHFGLEDLACPHLPLQIRDKLFANRRAEAERRQACENAMNKEMGELGIHEPRIAHLVGCHIIELDDDDEAALLDEYPAFVKVP